MSLRRLYGLCAVLVLLAGVVLCRTYWVGQQTAYAASAGGQSVQTLALPRARGDFYDRTGRRLTGLSPQYYALCLPGDAGYTALFPYVPYAEQSLLYERRNLASPFLIQVDRDLTAQGITTCTVPQHFGGSTAAHLLGYLDSEGRGVSGLEKAYDDLLTASGDARTVTCFMTAQGRLLTDTSPLGGIRRFVGGVLGFVRLGVVGRGFVRPGVVRFGVVGRIVGCVVRSGILRLRTPFVRLGRRRGHGSI